MKVSVVIPCYNAEQTLPETLTAVTQQKWEPPWEIVVANNGSTDGSSQVVSQFQQKFEQLRLVEASAGRGTPFAINAGVAAAKGRSVVFCDADDIPSTGWLAAMGNALETNGFVAARMDFSALNSPLVAQTRRGFQDEDIPRIEYPPYLYHAGGGSLGVWRDLFLDVGGYDKSLVYLHETDFCFKVQLAGVPLHFVKDALIHVRCRSDLSKTFSQARKWAAYNVLLAKRYRNHGTPKPGEWMRLLKETKTVMKKLRQWHRLNEINRFQSAWQIGWCLGKWEGVVKFHAKPF